jgi:hypothetical protein
MPTKTPVSDIVDTIDEAICDDHVSVGTMLASFDRDALLPTLIAPAILVFSPLSAIPLFSSICGLSIFLIAVQGAFGRSQPWLPAFLTRRTIPKDRGQKATLSLARVAHWLDAITRKRIPFLVSGRIARKCLYLICAFAAGMIPLLELVPMSSSLIGAGVALIATGMLARDGIFALAGLFFIGLAAVVPWFVVTQGSALLS